MTWEVLLELIKKMGGSWRTFSRKVPGIAYIPATKAVPASKGRAAIPGIPATPSRPETTETVYEIKLPDEKNVLLSIGQFVKPDEAEATLGAVVMQRFERAATKKAEVEEKKAKEAERKQGTRDLEERNRQATRGIEDRRRADVVAAAKAKAAQEAQAQQAAAPYSNPAQPPPFAPIAGQRWQWDEPRERWAQVEIIPRQLPRTLEEALTRGTEQEINAFMEARRLGQELSPAEQEQQAYNRQRQVQTDQLSLFDRMLARQRQQLDIAKSPGDYALWWDMLTRGQDVTPQDFANFQRSGVRASLYPQSQELQPQEGQPQTALAPTPNETYDQAAAALQAFIAGGGTQGMTPQQLDITNQAWTERIRAAEAQAPATAISQAQAQGERPLSLAEAKIAKAQGTLPKGVLFQDVAPWPGGAAGSNLIPQQTQAGQGGAVAARPDFMRLLFNRQNLLTPPRRTIANITGETLPSGQTFNRLAPSQQQGYLASYAPGVPREDFLEEFRKSTMGFQNMPRRLLFRPRGA